MWISPFLSRVSTAFFPQAQCGKVEVFNRHCGRNFCSQFFHSLSLHIPQPLWKTFGVNFSFMGECYFLVSEQESNQRSRLKEALKVALPRATAALLKNPPGAHYFKWCVFTGKTCRLVAVIQKASASLSPPCRILSRNTARKKSGHFFLARLLGHIPPDFPSACRGILKGAAFLRGSAELSAL